MGKTEMMMAVLEICRQIEELIKQEGEGAVLIINPQEWTDPNFHHQN